MKRPLLIGGGLLALYYLLGSEKTYPGGFKYDIGGAAKSILSDQVALGFHPCGIGWAIQKIGEKQYTLRVWSLEGNNWIPSGLGIQPVREILAPGVEHLYGIVGPGQDQYSSDLPVKVFEDVVTAGNSVSRFAAGIRYEKDGRTKDVFDECLEAPAVARKGKINATGVTTLQNWLAAGGKDLQA